MPYKILAWSPEHFLIEWDANVNIHVSLDRLKPYFELSKTARNMNKEGLDNGDVKKITHDNIPFDINVKNFRTKKITRSKHNDSIFNFFFSFTMLYWQKRLGHGHKQKRVNKEQ